MKHTYIDNIKTIVIGAFLGLIMLFLILHNHWFSMFYPDVVYKYMATHALEEKYNEKFIAKFIYHESDSTYYVSCIPLSMNANLFEVRMNTNGNIIYDGYISGIISNKICREIEQPIRQIWENSIIFVSPGVMKNKTFEENASSLTMKEFINEIKNYNTEKGIVFIFVPQSDLKKSIPQNEYSMFSSIIGDLIKQELIPNVDFVIWIVEEEYMEIIKDHWEKKARFFTLDYQIGRKKYVFGYNERGEMDITYDEYCRIREDVGKNE